VVKWSRAEQRPAPHTVTLSPSGCTANMFQAECFDIDNTPENPLTNINNIISRIIHYY